MAFQVTMPQMGYDMTEGSINRWLVAEGDQVERGDIIASIATEKADIDIEAYASGIMRKILVAPGITVPVGGAIAVIGDPDEPLDDLTGPAAEPAAEAAPSGDGEAEPTAKARADEGAEAAPVEELPAAVSAEPAPAAAPTTSVVTPGTRVKASPLARTRARELGIELSRVHGTGPDGRVTGEDVEAVARSGGVAAVASTPTGSVVPIDPTDPSEPVKVSRMREAIARRMTEANSTIPHFYLSTEVDMEKLMRLRQELNDLGDPGLPRFSVTDFIVRAMALTLQRYQQLNAAYVGGGLRRFFSSNIALAVAVPDGLVAPTLRSCESLTFAELARRAHDLALRAKSNRLRPEEMAGAHTAISNLGMFGISQFGAIVTPGQGSVLAVGQVRQVPVARDGQLAVGPVMEMTLSIDHRVTDGAQGAEALGYLRWCLEHPTACLV
ncbi:MAG TPA: dihydrolipoamide acetyltransferase family protein [Candidatus Nanopelagicaceae bacterium]|nr:dihydrolipoamide acetyltransferase family protein [Candidatus Nanopelagicaceae bacterium]